jgi:hypothetical protein
MKFAVADLFLVGTVLDLLGGVLIAKGLLVSLRVLAARSATFWSSNPHVAVGAVEDRVDASAGLLTLAVGFTLQAAGYVATLAAEPRVAASGARAFTALGLAVIVAAVSVAAWWAARPRMIRRNLILLARLDVKDSASRPLLRDLPDLNDLATYGRAWKGRQSKMTEGPRDEIDRDEVRLIFGDVETQAKPAKG